MHMKLAMFLVLAGGVAGCASNPPPPPMAMAPEPAPMAAPMAAPMTPAPMMSGSSMAGRYTGTVEAASSNRRSCRRMGPTASATVRGRSITMGSVRAVASRTGALSGVRRGAKVTGTMSGDTIDAMATIGRCRYHYVLNKA